MPNSNWTLATGIRHLLISLIFRALIAAVLWGGLLFLIAPVFLSGKFVLTGFASLLFPLPPGLIMGFILSWKLQDNAGFGGVIVTGSATVAAIAAVLLGALTSNALRPFGTIEGLYFYGGLIVIYSMAVIIKFTIVDG